MLRTFIEMMPMELNMYKDPYLDQVYLKTLFLS